MDLQECQGHSQLGAQAIFSMPLMQINDHNLALRIYIGIAIALTFAVGMLWNWWRLHRNNKAVDIHVDEFSRPLYRLDSPQYVPPEGPRHYPTRPPSPVIIMPPQTVPIGLNSHFDNQRSVEIKVAPRTPVIVPSIPPSPLNPPAPRKDQPKHISLALSDALSRASPNMPWDTSHGTSKADHDPHNNARLDSRIRSRAPSPVPSADEDGKESFHTAASDQSQHISSQTSSESFVQVSLPLKTKSRSIFDPNAAPFIGYGMWAPDASSMPRRRPWERYRSRSRRRRYRSFSRTPSPRSIPDRSNSRSRPQIIRPITPPTIVIPPPMYPTPVPQVILPPRSRSRGRSRSRSRENLPYRPKTHRPSRRSVERGMYPIIIQAPERHSRSHSRDGRAQPIIIRAPERRSRSRSRVRAQPMIVRAPSRRSRSHSRRREQPIIIRAPSRRSRSADRNPVVIYQPARHLTSPRRSKDQVHQWISASPEVIQGRSRSGSRTRSPRDDVGYEEYRSQATRYSRGRSRHRTRSPVQVNRILDPSTVVAKDQRSHSHTRTQSSRVRSQPLVVNHHAASSGRRDHQKRSRSRRGRYHGRQVSSPRNYAPRHRSRSLTINEGITPFSHGDDWNQYGPAVVYVGSPSGSLSPSRGLRNKDMDFKYKNG